MSQDQEISPTPYLWKTGVGSLNGFLLIQTVLIHYLGPLRLLNSDSQLMRSGEHRNPIVLFPGRRGRGS